MKGVLILFCIAHVRANLTIVQKNDSSTMRPEKNLEKNITSEHKTVYLEDVVFSLKSQNWTKDQVQCLEQTLFLLSSLKNYSLWAVWEWDSVSSEPMGVLFGNRYQLGNFDECVNAPWEATHPELRTQYCLADIVLQRTDKSIKRKSNVAFDPYSSAIDFMEYRTQHTRPLNELTWGACVPASCSPASVKRLISIMLARSHFGTTSLVPQVSVPDKCQKSNDKMPFDAGFYMFWVVVGIAASLSIVCCYYCSKSDPNSSSLKTDILRAFSLKENAQDLLVMKEDGIEVMYGIRFLSMCFIVADHQLGIWNGGPVSDGLIADKIVKSTYGMFLLHNDLFVDSFFFLSSFLTVMNLMKFKRLPSPLILIFKRYVRLVICFAVVVFFMSSVFPYTGSGPLWPAVVESETGPCQRNWWLSLLMLNNYINSEDICLVVTWYIPCDFHFFCITVIMYWFYQKYPRLTFTCFVMIVLASLILPGLITQINHLPAVQLFTYDFIVNPRASKQFHLTYIKSHTRMAAYIVGLICGYIFTRCSQTGHLDRINKRWSLIGALFGLLIMLVVMVTGAIFVQKSYQRWEGSVYASLDRPVWTIGLGILVLCCALGSVPLIKSFLSWYPWVPLSRLAYGIYLTHTVIIARNVSIARNSRHNDAFFFLVTIMGTVFLSSIASLLILLLFEGPTNKLLMIALKPRSKVLEKPQIEQNNREPQIATSVSQIVDASGHYQKNLSSNMQIYSKM